MAPELTLEDVLDLAQPEDRDEATCQNRIGHGTPGSPDIWVSDAVIAQKGHREVRRTVRRTYESLSAHEG